MISGSFPRLGLALGGGGARGNAHIGVLQVLEEESIPIGCLAGTSIGGIIAAAYAAGLGPWDIEAEALGMAQLRNLVTLVDRQLPLRGLISGDRMEAYFKERVRGLSFEQTRIPLAVVAVDLVTGQEVVIRHGPLAPAMRATASVPGIFSPAKWEGHQLVDGGILNNLPVDVVRGMGADLVVAVQLSPGLEDFPLASDQEGLSPGLIPVMKTIDVLRQTVNIMEGVILRARLEAYPPDVLIRPDMGPHITVLGGFSHAAESIAAGREAARAALPALREALAQAGSP